MGGGHRQPFRPLGTVTAGIVSAQSRDINSGPYDDFIQTDAPINNGNSGGSLLSVAGGVIGVNTATFSPTGGNVGIGFAVPAHLAQRVVEDLKDDGMVERGQLATADARGDHQPRLGVTAAPLSPELRRGLDLPETLQGLAITGVDDGSAAARARLAQGDVIVRVGDREATGMDAERHALERAEAEERPVLMRVYSGATYRFVAVPLDEDT